VTMPGHMHDGKLWVVTAGNLCSGNCQARGFDMGIHEQCFAFSKRGLPGTPVRIEQGRRCAACRKAYPEEAAK
jgi:hypothetical protein